MPMWLKHLLGNKTHLLILFIWLLAIAIRLYGITTPPQYYDMATFQAWGAHMLAVGPTRFYDNTWSDYLPLPLYAFAPILAAADYLHLPFGVVFKTVMSLLELILIFCVLRAWPLKRKIIPLAFLALSPALIGDTAFWGQVDTIPALLTTLSFLTLSPVLFGLAVAIKPIMILTAPILWILAIRKGRWWQFPLISGLTFLVTGLPMAGLATLQLLWERTVEQAGTYPFTTINAWNLWSLVPPGSWPPDNQTILGISPYFFGLTLFLLLTFRTMRAWKRTKWDPKYGFRVAATILIVFYTFTTRMHERHLLFGLPLLALAAGLESWLLIPMTILTLTFTLNLYAAFSWVNHAQTWPFPQWGMGLVSWFTTLTALALGTIWHWPKFFSTRFARLKLNKLLVGVLLLAALLRLVNLGFPTTYIFDEVYHAFTAKEYLHNHVVAWEWWTTPPEGVAYEWTHPPVAKYAMVAGMLLFGEHSAGYRVGSAVAGVMSIWGLYLLVEQLTKNKKAALLSAFLVSIEGLHIAQSRVSMNDIYMLAFFIWALYAGVKSRWKSAAVLFGLAFATKWSAIYGLLPLALIYLNQHHPKTWGLKSGLMHLLFALRYMLIAICVYLLTFAPFILAGHTWAQLIELHRQMWYYHTHLVATHTFQSTPLQWIFAARPVWYYVNYGVNIANIYAQGNPLILWLGLVAFVLQIKKLRSFPFLLIATCYLVLTVPWVISPRIMFFYHYLPSATFLCVILTMWLADLPSRARLGLLILCSVGLLILSPVLYGFPMPSVYWDTLFTLFPSWK